MRKRKHVLPYLLTAVISLLALIFFTIFINPEITSSLGSFTISPIIFFFILLFVLIFSIMTFLTINIRLGLITSGFVISILFLQIIGFLNLIYAGILLAVAILIELGFRHK